MIQRMNNVLIKHSKVLFGVITIVIIISFVWFFTPGADGSLLFTRNSNVIAKIGTEDVTMNDAERAQKSAMLGQASALYAIHGEKAENLFSRMGRMGDDNLRVLATTLKLAEIQGFAVADKEVQDVIKNDPAFHENGKFSGKKYEAFLAVLDKAGFSSEEYENATRDALLLEKFQRNALVGVAEPTMNEVEANIAPMCYKFTNRRIVCNTEDIRKTIAAPTDAELKAEYDSAPESFVSLPVSDATIFFINHKDVNVKDLDKQTEERYNTFAAKQEKKATAEEAKATKDRIRSGIIAGEAMKILDEIVKEAGAAPTAEALKAAADKKGFKLQSSAISDVTLETAPSPLVDQGMIYNICMIPEVNTFSQVVSNKDTAAVALLTKREDAKQLDFEAAKAKVAERLKTKKANQKAEEILNAFKADIVSGKIALDKIAEEGKKLGLTVGDEQVGTASNAETFHRTYMQAYALEMQLQQLRNAFMTGDQQKIAEIVPAGLDVEEYALQMQMYTRQLLNSLGEFYNAKLGYVSPVSGNSLWVVVKAEAVAPSAELLQAHKAYLFEQKRSSALQSWQTWYTKVISAAIGPYIQKQADQPAEAAE